MARPNQLKEYQDWENSKRSILGASPAPSPQPNPQPTPSVLPSGTIIMWTGLSTQIPAGWLLCDGTNGTPDLSGSFIVQA